jgi:hypothetical protein
MHFVRKQMVEMPFILNLPKGNYEVTLPEGLRILRVHHGLYAGTAGAFEYRAPLSVAEKDRLIKSFPDGTCLSLHQLRTVIERVVTCDVMALVELTESDVLDEIAVMTIRERSSTSSGEKLRAEAADRFQKMSADEKEAVARTKAMKLTAKQVFREQTAEYFFHILNTLIRHYMVAVDDFFAEELALHQIASTTLGGIHETTFCDDLLVDTVRTVGKIPPIMRQPWYEHDPQKIQALKDALSSGQAPDAIALLGIRARALLERGAFRSAIVEAAAALETAVARRLLGGLIAQGRSEDDALAQLHENQRFADRCKSIFHDVVGCSLAAKDEALWSRVVIHRERLRSRIVHSDEEPSAADAQKVVEDFLSFAVLARTASP